MVARTSLLVSSIALLTSFVNAYGQVAQIVDANNFCVFLPPTDSTDRLISDTEWNAQAFCHGKAPKATNAGKLESGFIQSAHYVKTKDYVQITGQIDPSKANLDPTDEGGQYDVKAPKGATCAGWTYFVNLIEPAGNTYCIRCCNDTTNCNRGISSKGCAHIIPGDYSGPFTGVASAPAASSTSAAASSTKASGSKATSTKKGSSKTTTAAAKATSDASSSDSTTDADAGKSTTTPASSSDDSSAGGIDLPIPSADSADAAGSTDAGVPASSASSSSTAPNAAAEIASPPAAAASSSSAAAPSSGNGVISEQSVQQQEESGAESLRPAVLTLAIAAVSMALIQ
ncbi:hypothetical protein K501DRAFT_235875 [Backusella circina FSU 941]|nr:hypothetical protein K501DRAFT_235875 [Backusella circina FSU 941]